MTMTRRARQFHRLNRAAETYRMAVAKSDIPTRKWLIEHAKLMLRHAQFARMSGFDCAVFEEERA